MKTTRRHFEHIYVNYCHCVVKTANKRSCTLSAVCGKCQHPSSVQSWLFLGLVL